MLHSITAYALVLGYDLIFMWYDIISLDKNNVIYVLARCQGWLEVSTLWVFVDSLQSLENCFTISKHSVCQEKCVQKVDAQKSEVCQTIQKTLYTGMSNLQNKYKINSNSVIIVLKQFKHFIFFRFSTSLISLHLICLLKTYSKS